MITLNPAVSSSNLKRTKTQAQGKVNFKRGFEAKELEKLQKNSADTMNVVMAFIRTNIIRKQDGALQQIQAIHGKFDERWYGRITEALENQKPTPNLPPEKPVKEIFADAVVGLFRAILD